MAKKPKLTEINITLGVNFYLIKSGRAYMITQMKKAAREAGKSEEEVKRIKLSKLQEVQALEIEEPIFMYITFAGDNVQIPVGVKVKAKHWTKNQKVSDDAKNADDINDLLTSMGKWAKRVHADGMKARYYGDEYVPINFFKKSFEALHRKANTTIYPLFDEFLEYKRQQGIKKGTIKNYQGHRDALESWQPELKLTDLTIEFEEVYLEHFKNKGIGPDQIMNNKTRFKTFLEWTIKKRYNKNTEFRSWEQSLERVKAGSNLHPLELDELKALENLEGLDQSHREARDIFLFNANFGLRYSDLKKLLKAQIVKDSRGYVFDMTTEKTGERIRPYLNKTAVRIWKAYENTPGPKAFPVPSNSAYNDRLQTICRIAGIKTMVETIEKRGGETFKQWVQKWQTVTSHTARDTFCTIAYNDWKFSLEEITYITGHTNTAMLKRYAKPGKPKMKQLRDKANANGSI